MKEIKVIPKRYNWIVVDGLDDYDILDFMRATNATVRIELDETLSIIDYKSEDLKALFDMIIRNHDVDEMTDECICYYQVYTFTCWD